VSQCGGGEVLIDRGGSSVHRWEKKKEGDCRTKSLVRSRSAPLKESGGKFGYSGRFRPARAIRDWALPPVIQTGLKSIISQPFGGGEKNRIAVEIFPVAEEEKRAPG